MEKATLYGVGIGPGDPELLTLKAVNIIKKCEVIVTPESNGNANVALEITKGAVDLTGKEIVKVEFPMIRDKEELKKSHHQTALKLIDILATGKDIALINLGDVSVFSTFSYVVDDVLEAGYNVEMIPGVTSFCAVASRLTASLTTMNEPLHIIPAGDLNLDETLSLKGTKVIMKSGKKTIGKVKQTLKEKGLMEKAMAVQNCGMPNEIVCKDVDAMSEDISYFTTIIVRG